jgi:hypothetical protein
MATRKRKSEAASTTEPVVVQGTHLTVTTWPDGRTQLKWDDEALLREVQLATASVKKPAVRAKSARKNK